MTPISFDPFILRHSSPLIKRLLERKKHLSNSKNRKTALILGPGGMKGAYGSGVAAALGKLGLQDVFDIVIGISVGSVIGSYFVSKQAELLPEIACHDLADKRFIHLLRMHRVFNLDYFDKVLTKIKPLDQQMIKKSATQFYIGVTNATTAQGKFIDINKEKVDVLTAIHASASLPLLQPKPVIIDNKRYIDGAIGCDFPIAFAVEKGCTDILFVVNNSLESLNQVSLFDKLLINLLPYSRVLKRAVKAKKPYEQEIYDEVRHFSKDATIGIIAPEELRISSLDTDEKKLKPIAENAYKQTIKIFS